MAWKTNKRTGGKFYTRSRRSSQPRIVIKDHGAVAGKYRFEGKHEMHSTRAAALASFK